MDDGTGDEIMLTNRLQVGSSASTSLVFLRFESADRRPIRIHLPPGIAQALRSWVGDALQELGEDPEMPEPKGSAD